MEPACTPLLSDPKVLIVLDIAAFEPSVATNLAQWRMSAEEVDQTKWTRRDGELR